ncbi:MAG: hypothetical protein K2Q28_11995 [Hyphomicrobium sp.]|nr:hypothetical protein [Hyphomicrobium sp.]
MTKFQAMAIIGFLAALVPAQSSFAVEGNLGKVKACSPITDKCATGAVRNTAYGQQVQLPGGKWVNCAGDCSRKLRKNTVDFWQYEMLQN